ncbi:MAG: hypothetical protein VX644_12665 [Planctomycetota bacterium]|nr:hypothetical protein [Planctomycetota bacterium]
MLRRAWGTAISLLIVLTSYAAYALLIVPWIEPPAQANNTAGIDAKWLPMTPRRQEELGKIFPPGSWQLDSPTIIESNYGTLIFKQNTRSDDALEIKPCTLIVYAQQENSGLSSGMPRRRAYVLDAPEGAMLEHEGNLNFNQTRGGRITRGRLLGKVSIYSAATSANSDDAIHISTRNVQIDRQRIWTPHEVDFRMGPHHGSGQDLVITLARVNNPDRVDQSPDVFNTIDSMELIHVDGIHLQLSRQLLARQPTSATAISSDPTKPQATTSLIPVEIQCQGPLRMDLRKQVVSLEKHVDVLIRNPAGPVDQLTCQRLDLRFRPQSLIPANPTSPTVIQTPGKTSKPNARIEPLELAAIGNPVILRAPSVGAIARAQRVLLNLPHRRILLEDTNQALIVQNEHQLVAPHIEYQFPPQSKQLGQFVATGPGRYEGKSRAATRPEFMASWQQECRLTRKQDRHVFSLVGKAQISQPQQGTVQADDLHLWFQEIPVATPGPMDGNPTITSQDSLGNNSSSRLTARIRPQKMVFRGNVQIDTQQLSATTKLIEIWFRESSAVAPISNPGQLPAGPRSSPTLTLPATRSNTKLNVKGDHVQLQVNLLDPQPAITHMTVEGDVALKQLTVPASSNDSFQLHAQVLQLKRYASGFFNVSIRGEKQPADIQVGSMKLIGSDIHLDQEVNRMWVTGPGQMHLLPKQKQAGQPQNTTRISWAKQLDFDGQMVSLEKDVQTVVQSQGTAGETTLTRISGALLQTTFDRHLDLRKPDRTTPLQLGRLTYGGNVKILSQTHASDGNPLAVDQLHVHSMTLHMTPNSQKGDLKATGPGWGSSVRVNPRKQTPAINDQDPSRPRLPGSDSNLIYVRVQFENGIVGNIMKRYIRFYRRVQTIYGPVANWNSTLSHDTLGEEGIELTSDQLQIADLQYRGKPSLVMEALGSTRIDSMKYSALAHRLTYAQSNSLLTLDGDRDHAELVIKPRRQTPDVIAGKIMYWLDTNRLQVERAIRLDLGRIPSRP